MTILTILKIIAAIGTVGTGLLALLKPKSIDGFTGITATGPRGITEIRAIFGGLFIGLGAAAILLNVPAAYQMLGITYGAIAVVRVFLHVSRPLDRKFQYHQCRGRSRLHGHSGALKAKGLP